MPVACRKSTASALLFVLMFGAAQGEVVRTKKSNRLDENGVPLNLKPPGADRITAESLGKRRQFIEENRKLMKVESEGIPMNRSIYDNSSILAFNGKHTVLPKGAVAWVPEGFKDRVVEKPTGEFVLWPEFYRLNRGWISTMEVSLEQAKGEKPMSPEEINALRLRGVLVVSLFRQHPISFKGKFETEDPEK